MGLVSNLKALTVVRVTEPELEGGNWWYPASSGSRPGAETADDFSSYVERAYRSNGIVFACVLARMMPFSEARFLYQEVIDGNPGRLMDGPGLEMVRSPWTNAATGDLLARMEQNASLSGNYYATPVSGRMRQLRPDWVTILSGVRGEAQSDPFALEAEIIGYFYDPGGRGNQIFISADRMVHYAPIPDPNAQWRGMSWLTPVLSEIAADSQMTDHKHRFLKQGASLSFAISYDKALNAAQVRQYAELFAEQHQGASNAYKTLHLGGGADPKVIGTSLKDLDFRSVQGAGETRIAAAAGVGAIIARFSEGLQGSSLNQGNYEAAKRQFADMTLRPLWRAAAGALQKVTSPPDGSRLWYDTRDIEFLKADRKDAAEIQGRRAETVGSLVQSGYTPESAVQAVEADDFTLLEHSGLYSVQLQAPGSASAAAD